MPGPSLIGLTGGIAAGKSEALRVLADLGAETLSTDAVVHELLGTEEVRAVLIDRWGDRVAPAGELDRGRIAGIVFEEPEELTWLESILHPLVGSRVVEWREGLAAGTDVAVVEVPLLFEGTMAEVFDATIAVVAEDDVRTSRAAERGTGELEERSARQLSQDEKAARATFVVHNNGTVDQLERELGELFGALADARS
ncbi:MAG TPA: dephospho-CoA kinase [Solirubrobacterales bacterium]|nr:dephospho-CoA kinase [Solirubrobacterales bacterium]